MLTLEFVIRVNRLYCATILSFSCVKVVALENTI